MMYKWVNGNMMEMTEEEISAQRSAQLAAEAEERTRPLTESEVTRLLIARQINTLTVDDNTALRMQEFYPTWTADTDYTTGVKVKHGGKLWRCRQAHTSQSGWEPSTATSSLWEQINESHTGTMYDPIPYDGNMALKAGKYYYQDYTIYLCNRDTVNPVYNPLAELVGIYVELA